MAVFWVAKFRTPAFGELKLVKGIKGLERLLFQSEDISEELKLFEEQGEVLEDNSQFDQEFLELQQYFQGKRENFSLALNPQGTVFQQKVWSELQKIPFGQVISYKELAKRVGSPKGFRAVGGANGKNPIPIIIPCHRVINEGGKLGGYSSGLLVKQQLLQHEGVL